MENKADSSLLVWELRRALSRLESTWDPEPGQWMQDRRTEVWGKEAEDVQGHLPPRWHLPILTARHPPPPQP